MRQQPYIRCWKCGENVGDTVHKNRHYSGFGGVEIRCDNCVRRFPFDPKPVECVCGRSVISRVGGKTCSTECSKWAYDQKRRQKRVKLKTCQHCTKTFMAKRKDARMCGPACRMAAMRIRKATAVAVADEQELQLLTECDCVR